MFVDIPLNEADSTSSVKTSGSLREHGRFCQGIARPCENEASVKVSSVLDHFTQSRVWGRLRRNVRQTPLQRIQMKGHSCSNRKGQTHKKKKKGGSATTVWQLSLYICDYFRGAGNNLTSAAALTFALFWITAPVFWSFFFIPYWNSFKWLSSS